MKALLLTIFLFFTFYGFSQDQIIKNNGEDIFCQITKIATDTIFYSLPLTDTKLIYYAIPRTEVKEYKLNVSTSSNPSNTRKNNDYVYTPPSKPIKSNKLPTPETELGRFRIGASGGFSYLLVPVDDEDPSGLGEYYKELKTGYHYSIDAYYYITEKVGLGVRYSTFRTKNSTTVFVGYPNGTTRYGTLTDNITNTLIGPGISYRLQPYYSKNPILLNLSIGHFDYKNDGYLIDPIKLTGNTVGLAMDVGYDIKLEKNLFLAIQMGFVFGSLSEAEIEYNGVKETISYPADQQQNMSRFDFSVGLRFGN